MPEFQPIRAYAMFRRYLLNNYSENYENLNNANIFNYSYANLSQFIIKQMIDKYQTKININNDNTYNHYNDDKLIQRGIGVMIGICIMAMINIILFCVWKHHKHNKLRKFSFQKMEMVTQK